jgi:ribosome biogenesis GTPase / thiamine phosphate phosphatase
MQISYYFSLNKKVFNPKDVKLKKGLVVKTTGSRHTVRTGSEITNCVLKGSFRTSNIRNTNPVAVGDNVDYELTGENTGIITRIESRKNYIIRKATNLSKENHILASNVDQLLLMITVRNPETQLEFIDRFLLSAEAYHIKSRLIINKMDLYKGKDIEKVSEINGIYSFAGYSCHNLSLETGEGLEYLTGILRDRISVVAGNSGVGKSTFINRIVPGLKLKTLGISGYHLSGKHATTYAEMIELPSGGYIIDTPGIRGFGLTGIEKNEVGLYFTDIFRLSKECRFYNCTHIHEPGCAVIAALEKGILHESRYRSYCNIFLDNRKKYRTG